LNPKGETPQGIVPSSGKEITLKNVLMNLNSTVAQKPAANSTGDGGIELLPLPPFVSRAINGEKNNSYQSEPKGRVCGSREGRATSGYNPRLNPAIDRLLPSDPVSEELLEEAEGNRIPRCVILDDLEILLNGGSGE